MLSLTLLRCCHNIPTGYEVIDDGEEIEIVSLYSNDDAVSLTKGHPEYISTGEIE